LSSHVLSGVGSGVLLLGTSNIGCVVGDVAYNISGSVGSKFDWLHYFIFTSALFSHGLKGGAML
jgi:hypothetical protein